jgi:hypothetical protein
MSDNLDVEKYSLLLYYGVDIARTDVSKEPNAFIISVTIIGEL